jgi:hypothetical protein
MEHYTRGPDYIRQPSYAAEAAEFNDDDPRALRYIANFNERPSVHHGEYAPLDQRELWAQMRFSYDVIDSTEKLRWWQHYIATHSPGASAGFHEEAEGVCCLYMCYFMFREVPCIAVPLYRNRKVGLAQGIVRFTHAAGYAGLYQDLHHHDHHHHQGAEKKRLLDGIHDLGVSLLAAVCQSMNIVLLFASPIEFFRHMLLLFLDERRVRHWLGNDATLTYGGIGIDCTQHKSASCFPPWCGQSDSTMYRVRLRQNPHDFARRDTRVDLGRHISDAPGMIPPWSIIQQRWILDAHNHDLIRAHRSGALDRYVHEHFPYNFLQQMQGEGVIVIDAGDLAQYSPVRAAVERPEPEDTFFNELES